MLWTSVKGYLYSAVAFLMAMIAGYAVYQKEQNEDLKEEIKDVEHNLETSDKKGKEIEGARIEEQNQNENIIVSEVEKSKSGDKVDGILDLSETEDVPVKL